MEFNYIVFADSLASYDTERYDDCVLHILCREGSMSFMLRDTQYNVLAGDYVILPKPALVTGFNESADFRATVMYLSHSFVSSMAIRSNYGIIGHVSLLQNPVMRLSPRDYQICNEDMQRIRDRREIRDHLFREEMLGHLLVAHILNLYDIHARGRELSSVSERSVILLRRFLGLRYHGEYIKSRDLRHYASQLCVTPHYLSEVCRKITGKPATYWIDRFTIHEIIRLFSRKELPLNRIADSLSFSSMSYFSRYVQRSLGVSPSAFRMRLK